MGLLIHLLVAEETGLLPGGADRLDLAIASCGNAALAAAVVARAGRRRLRVFAPTSAVFAAFTESQALGMIEKLPKVQTVQTKGGYSPTRAYQRLVEHIGTSDPDRIRDRFDGPEVQDGLTFAAHNRPEFMWPWEEEPKSVAHGRMTLGARRPPSISTTPARRDWPGSWR